MRKTLLFAFMLLVGFQSFGQNAVSEEELIKSYFKLTKKAIFEAGMGLTEEGAQVFWPIYNKYEVEVGNLNDKRIGFLNKYVENFENITDEQADEFVNEVFKYRKKSLSLKMKYYKQMKKSLSAKTATRFVEIEQYIQTAVRYEIMESLPFIGDEF